MYLLQIADTPDEAYELCNKYSACLGLSASSNSQSWKTSSSSYRFSSGSSGGSFQESGKNN